LTPTKPAKAKFMAWLGFGFGFVSQATYKAQIVNLLWLLA
jgi:hypothetical protein